MARIYKRGAVYWCQFQGRRQSLGVTDRQAAELAYKALQRAHADPHHAAANQAASASLADGIARLMRAKTAGRSEGTCHMYRVKTGHVARVFGPHARMADITPGTVDAYITRRQEEGAKNCTIGKELTAIVQLCKLAKRAGEYAGDISALRPPDFDAGFTARERVLTPAAETRLRRRMPRSQWAAVAFILGTGCRLGEALRAQPQDIDWEAREVVIRGTKTEAAAAVIPILDVAGMAGYLRHAQPFLPLTWTRISKGLPETCEAAGLEPLTPNDLRRTVATRLIEADIDPYDVAKITRHTTLTMLRRVYDRSSVAATRARIEKQSRGTKGGKVKGSRSRSRSRAAGTQTVHSPPTNTPPSA